MARRINYLHYLVNLDKDEMLSKIFQAQWEQSTREDWVEDVRNDLRDFRISEDLQFIKSKSKNAFNNLVKKKAREFEFTRLMKLKNEKSKSKMKNLCYVELRMQEYLELKSMTASQARALFQFRTRMAPFGENFRGGASVVACPLCHKHPDGQENSFTCEKIKSLIDVQGQYSDIFGHRFSPEIIKTVFNIFCFRDEYRKLST